MAPIKGSLPNLLNGVSRQPMSVRLPTQLQEQINGFSTPARGLQMRPPTFNIAKVTGIPANSFVHHINRDQAERYKVVVTDGDLRVWDLDGLEKTVTFPNGKAYLNCAASPIAAFAATTSADYTFIVNKEVTPIMDPASAAPGNGSEALVFVRAVNFSRTYELFIDGTVVASVSMTEGADDSHADAQAKQKLVSQVNLAKMMFWGSSVGGAGPGTWPGPADGVINANSFDNSVGTRLVDNLDYAAWDVVRYNNVLWIKKRDGTPFSIRAECDGDGTRDSIITVKDRIQDFPDLPNHGPLGYVVKVTNSPTSGFDDFWVKITKPNGNDANDSIVWKECPAPGSLTDFDTTLMPHTLIRNADGTFTFQEHSWHPRKVGDATTDTGAPPSFVGTTINDIFFHRGRLGVLCDESVVMTRPGKFFDWWRTTMTAILDDDPIDVAGTDDVVSIFQHAVTYNEELYLSSSNAMHRLSAGDLITQKTVKLTLAIREPINVDVKPTATTRSIVWAGSSVTSATTVDYSDIRELYIADETQKSEPQSISDHVPGYIPSNLTSLVSSPVLDMLVGYTTNDSGKLWVYQYYWTQSEKVQSAWHTWEIGDGVRIMAAQFFDNVLHLTLNRSGDMWSEKVPCSHLIAEQSRGWMIRLDRRVDDPTGVYNAATLTTTYTLPYAADADTRAVRRDLSMFGMEVPIASYVGTSVVLTGDTTGYEMVFGQRYTAEFELGQFYLRSTSSAQAVISQQSTRVQVLRVFPQYVDTAYFRVEVIPYPGASTMQKPFSPLIFGDALTATDAVVLRTGAMGAPVRGRNDRVNIKLVNDTHLPCAFTGLEWEGINVPRGRPV
jgi:hypothetical protein